LAAAGYHPPAGSVVHDLRGRYVLPGFIDMNAHVLFPPLDDDGRPLAWFDRDTSRALLRTLLLHGVTTVRDPGDATEAAVAIRRMLARGEIVGPRLFTAGRILQSSRCATPSMRPRRMSARCARKLRGRRRPASISLRFTRISPLLWYASLSTRPIAAASA